MATRAQIAAARRNIKKAQAARRRGGKKKTHGRRRRAASAAANPRKRRHRRRAASAAANPRKRTRRRAASAAANPRRRRRRAAAAANPRPRRRRRAAASNNSWYGNTAGHRRAAKKGVRRKARRRSHRDNPATTVNVNAWPGQPRRHAKAAKKGWKKRRRGHAASRRRTTGRKRCKPCRPRRDSSGKFTGGFSRRELAALANPTSLGSPTAYANAGIGSMSTWASFGTAAVATALGLVVADFVDRIVATRKPADTSTMKAVRPWYGRDAAAAQRMRPDGWRLGVQAVGAVISLGLAFWTRNIKFVPWALGGIALGFGSNLIMKITTWWLMPALFKIGKTDEQTIANRTYVLEQDATQKVVTSMFEKWSENPSLSQQQQKDNPVILGPLASAGPGGAYALGKGDQGKGKADGSSAPSSVGASSGVVQTGRLGLCPFCKHVNGCLEGCPSLCPKCSEYRPFIKGRYTVQAGDNLTQLAALGAVRIDDVSALNGGASPEAYWQIGKSVLVPYGLAMVLEQRDSSKSNVGAPPAPSTPSPTPAPPAAPTTPAPTPPSATSAEPPPVVAQRKPLNLNNIGYEADAE